ncbi:MAG: hypothetical protein NTW03_09435, partial [Verrucomicrobia bacterium]|nr:hypothetical protein [Verrucomicrobiota bacterium]
RPMMHLAGDGNIMGQENQGCTNATIHTNITFLNPNRDDPSWSSGGHVNAGNMALVDGSVHQLSQSGLVKHLVQTGDPTLNNCVLKSGSWSAPS